MKDAKEPPAAPMDARREGNLLAITYPGGVMDATRSMGDKDAEASFKPQEDAPQETLTPEVFF